VPPDGVKNGLVYADAEAGVYEGVNGGNGHHIESWLDEVAHDQQDDPRDGAHDEGRLPPPPEEETEHDEGHDHDWVNPSGGRQRAHLMMTRPASSSHPPVQQPRHHGRVDDLLRRWADLIGDEAAGRQLLVRWSEPHRRYHDLGHLRSVLQAVDELAAHADDLTSVRLAAWFHDAVHAGRPGQDERASAELAATMLPALGGTAEQVAEVVRLVELTETHAPAPDDSNGAVLCDADLSVLGGDPDSYAAYAAAVREEYADVSEEAFRSGRITVLERLLAHGRLFRTAAGRERWEAAARRNVASELTLLRAGASAS
jgi:predicted metal-dependent HD superfamily phosphohydrolase